MKFDQCAMDNKMVAILITLTNHFFLTDFLISLRALSIFFSMQETFPVETLRKAAELGFGGKLIFINQSSIILLMFFEEGFNSIT